MVRRCAALALGDPAAGATVNGSSWRIADIATKRRHPPDSGQIEAPDIDFRAATSAVASRRWSEMLWISDLKWRRAIAV